MDRSGKDEALNLLVACNLIFNPLCKKWGLLIQPMEHDLVGFNGDDNRSIDISTLSLQIGEWEHEVFFHVVEGKVQPIGCKTAIFWVSHG